MYTVEKRLATILSRNWWVLLLRGLAAILFGIAAFVWPGATVATLVLLFGSFALVDGILEVWTAIAGRKEYQDWWVLLLRGLVGVGVGILTLVLPGVTAMALLFYIAIWAIATGVLEIATAIKLRREIAGEWLLIFEGLASVAFGVLLMARPGAGALAVVWLIAIYAVVFGILLVVLAFRVRALSGQLSRQ
ncbi:MAG: HdeD family acid-resistance protein [Anaerolineae bacterium]|nr:HdeD family acid-resistance protein [Anaerolineae bacterium]